MISFLIFFIVSSIVLRKEGSLFFSYINLKNSQKYNKNSKNTSFFEKIMKEMLENLKKQQEFFNQHSQQGSQNHSYSSSSQRGGASEISKKEALEILGLPDSATEDEIKAKFKLLILKFHPDSGGNEYFCRKITNARDILLKK